ncbi:dipeptidase [Pararhodobacter aggregans]|uniref:Peptidase M19 n=1 Tax=Pararhodobacter aggregans TaxID=404875 RepID=A0A2T7UNJ9_9RHOB|nr:membrane dipeptidase [Pararhodobacter aggregans]PTX00764.1 dipeptidase AC [Pararhodobacter aggregans]PVE46295.1 peptidase M19 [Pararhodobacter aggregans]
MQVFDGHNDVLSRLWCAGGDPVQRFARDEGHISAPAARAGGFAGGLFALYSPQARRAFDFRGFRGGTMPLSNPMEQNAALQSVMAEVGIARRLQAAGLIRLCTDVAGIEAAMATGDIAAVLHLEGAECIDPELLVLDALHGMGLRSLGPVWSRPTIWGEGVPFGYDRDGDTGPGLTADGRRLIARCAELGIVVDTSHLTMKGFWEIGDMGLPLVATHSNAWDLCPATRNLTAPQLRAIGATGGMAGLNYATVFLSPEGWKTGRARLDDCLRQLEAMIEGAGEDHVGLGSDFDGAPLPEGMASCADLPALIAAMERAGFGAALIEKLCHGNWLAFLRRVWGA